MQPRALCLLALLSHVAVNAQVELVADFGSSTLNAFPNQLTACGDKLFFTAYTPNEGWELWVTDGTLAGSHLVKDINPGPAHGTDFGNSLTAMGNTLFFMARDAEHGRELWKSDGTEAGTVMVADIWAGPDESIPTKLTTVGDRVVFTAETEEGRYLFSTAGEEVASITEHKLDIMASVTPLVTGGVAYFSAWTPVTNSYALWSSDGGSADLVKNVPGINWLTAANGGFYFRANTLAAGPELWRSNGSEEGTALVADMEPGDAGLDPRYLVVMGGDLHFVGIGGLGPVLYRLAGGLAEMVSPTAVHVNFSSAYPVVCALDDRILFMHHEPATGLELYVTDGTVGGTVMVKDIHAGGGDGVGDLAYMYRADDAVYFAGRAAGAGRELWRTDGTEAGTVQVADIAQGSSDSNPSMFTRMGDHVYFHASGSTNAQQLYRVQVGTGTSVPVNASAAQPVVFPNPNNGSFHVRVPGVGASTFNLYDALGRSVPLVREGPAREGLWKFHGNGTAAGPHVLRITDAQGRTSAVPVLVE